MTRRAHDWDVRLADWAQIVIGQPMAWGQTDCVLASLEAVDVMTGTPLEAGLAARHRGKYDSLRTALAYQRDNDVDLPRELFGAGAVEIPRHYQQRGDILIGHWEEFLCGHVCFGERVLSVDMEKGVRTARTRDYMQIEDLRILRIE